MKYAFNIVYLFVCVFLCLFSADYARLHLVSFFPHFYCPVIETGGGRQALSELRKFKFKIPLGSNSLRSLSPDSSTTEESSFSSLSSL